jgi:hypothetical protein
LLLSSIVQGGGKRRAAGHVRAVLPDGTVDRIEGFATEGEAARWIRNESVAWLHSRKAIASNAS